MEVAKVWENGAEELLLAQDPSAKMPLSLLFFM